MAPLYQARLRHIHRMIAFLMNIGSAIFAHNRHSRPTELDDTGVSYPLNRRAT